MKPASYRIERSGATWIVSADGRKILSFDDEQSAVAAIAGAATLPPTAEDDDTHRRRRGRMPGTRR